MVDNETSSKFIQYGLSSIIFGSCFISFTMKLGFIRIGMVFAVIVAFDCQKRGGVTKLIWILIYCLLLFLSGSFLV